MPPTSASPSTSGRRRCGGRSRTACPGATRSWRRSSPSSPPAPTPTLRVSSGRRRPPRSRGGRKTWRRPAGCAAPSGARRSRPSTPSSATGATPRIRAPRPTSPGRRSSSCCSRGDGGGRGGERMGARKEFKVAVTKDNLVFASAHFITFPGHRCETLHGHNYRTRVVVEGGLDPEAHYVFDFSALKDLMKRLTDEIDHKVLLPTQNPKIAVQEQGDSLTVAVAGKPKYVFPKMDCALLPIPNTTVEMLAQYLAGRVCRELAGSGAVRARRRDGRVPAGGRAGVRHRRTVPERRRSAGRAARRRRGELGGDRAARGPVLLRGHPDRHRHHDHGHHPDRGRPRGRARPHRPRALARGRARVHGRAPHARGGHRPHGRAARRADRRVRRRIRARGRRAPLAGKSRTGGLHGADPRRATRDAAVRGRAARPRHLRGPGAAGRGRDRRDRTLARRRADRSGERSARTRGPPSPGRRGRRRDGAWRLHRSGGGAARRATRHGSHGAPRPRGPACPRSRGGAAARRPARTAPGALVTPRKQRGAVHTVVKIGGGMLSRTSVFDRVTAAIGEAARGRRLVIVPGGGPFADAVRQMFNRFGIGEEAAHWMAILGMDQYAHALVARISGAALVEGETEIAAALAAGRIPVLAPFRWLRTADPLPHSWDVTSDSIAAWLTGALDARRLVLIKPASRQPASQLVDAHFVRALPAGVEHLILTDDDLAQLELALREGGPEGLAPARQG